MEKITTDGRRFVDNYGRERIFHGINVVDKGTFNGASRDFERELEPGLCGAFYERGFNVVRLGFTWEAVEPEPGRYDDDYLAAVRGMLDELERHGIYAFIDMHQDLYSGFGDGSGDGAPAWACLTGGHRYKKHKFVWAEGYFWGKAVHTAFDSFWANAEVNGRGLQDWYADMWAHVAQYLAGHPALLGFDILNEPFPGTDGGRAFRKLIGKLARVTLCDREIDGGRLLRDALSRKRRGHVFDHCSARLFRKITSSADDIIRRFDTEKYSPFINKIASAVRGVSPDGIIFMENSYYSNLGIPYSAPEITVGGRRDKSFCFSPHGYDIMVDTEAYKYASSERAGVIFGEHLRSQERLNVPVLVGEWGGWSSGTEWFPHIRFLLETFDRNRWSFTYWAYFKGLLGTPFDALMRRAYPRAVTGVVTSFAYDPEGGVFTLEYRQEREFDAPTEVFLPKPAKKVAADGSFTLVDIDGGGQLLRLTTGAGHHSLRVEL